MGATTIRMTSDPLNGLGRDIDNLLAETLLKPLAQLRHVGLNFGTVLDIGPKLEQFILN